MRKTYSSSRRIADIHVWQELIAVLVKRSEVQMLFKQGEYKKQVSFIYRFQTCMYEFSECVTNGISVRTGEETEERSTVLAFLVELGRGGGAYVILPRL
jgi:hypothetical protein